MSTRKRILMVAAENDSLPGAKVGGVGDVIRDLPKALHEKNALVDTVIPSYGFLARVTGVERVGIVSLKFSGKLHDVTVLKKSDLADHYIFHHALFSEHGEVVYNNDGDDQPFAKDATKYAFFCSCVAQALIQGIVPRPDVIHCHDWHSAYLLILLKFGFEFAPLRDIKTAFTIHNLALQGIRPFDGHPSSFNRWFPDLRYSIDKLMDPRYPDCVNPMRAAILLADYVNTVSPSYAQEIVQESDHGVGFYGGEGLENALRERNDQGRVVGILNGCDYPQAAESDKPSSADLSKLMLASVYRWAASSPQLLSAHWLAEKSISRWHNKRTRGFTLTSVGRLTEQKMRLLLTPVPNYDSALHAIMALLDKDDSFLILGSGDCQIETFLSQASVEYPNIVFLNGYSSALSDALYHFGDAFLMPSSFEPCGISQMLAMRAGQPCLVNSVGGLKDTVEHMKTGFVFHGETASQQAEALVGLMAEVKSLYRDSPETWEAIRVAARAQRFTWSTAADAYLHQVYR